MYTHIIFWRIKIKMCVQIDRQIDNVEEYFYDRRIENNFLSHKKQVIKIFDKSDYKKIKNDYLSKDTMKRMIS